MPKRIDSLTPEWGLYMKIPVKLIIETPKIPNFFKTADGQTILISAITEDGLREVGREWTEGLVSRARELENDDL